LLVLAAAYRHLSLCHTLAHAFTLTNSHLYTYLYTLGPFQSRENRFECILFTAQSPGSYQLVPIHKRMIVSNPCSAPPFPSPHSSFEAREHERKIASLFVSMQRGVVQSLGKTPPPPTKEESSILQPHRHLAAHPFPFIHSLFLRCSPFSSSLSL
jgi:hypothetical protein